MLALGGIFIDRFAAERTGQIISAIDDMIGRGGNDRHDDQCEYPEEQAQEKPAND